MKKPFCKVIFFIVFFSGATLCSDHARAQKLIFLFAHAVYSSPVDSYFKSGYKFGAGAEAGVGVGLLGKTFFTGTVGYSDFIHSSGNSSGNISYIPVKIGIRHYLFAKILFVHADLGAGFINSTAYSSSSTKFAADIGAGVKLLGLEIIADYDGFTRSDPSSGFSSWIAIKAGFNIGL